MSILVPYDGSDPAAGAVEYAVANADDETVVRPAPTTVTVVR